MKKLSPRALFVGKLRKMYQATFKAPSAELVMADLAKFCYADTTTSFPDDVNGRASAVAEGRRQVFLRIQSYVNMDAKQIARVQQLSIMEQQTNE